jgi:hypothetical protein
VGEGQRKKQGNTKSDVFLYSGFAPLIQVASLATSQLEHLAASATTAGGTVRDSAGSESRVRKTCDQDGFNPVVEVAHSNDWRDAPLIDANIRSRII